MLCNLQMLPRSLKLVRNCKARWRLPSQKLQDRTLALRARTDASNSEESRNTSAISLKSMPTSGQGYMYKDYLTPLTFFSHL